MSARPPPRSPAARSARLQRQAEPSRAGPSAPAAGAGERRAEAHTRGALEPPGRAEPPPPHPCLALGGGCMQAEH